MKNRSPQRQSMSKSLVRNDDTIMRAVVHPALLAELIHGRIYDGVAGLPGTPGAKPLRIVAPRDAVVNGTKCTVAYMREVIENLMIKITPRQLTKPDFGTTAGLTGGRRNRL